MLRRGGTAIHFSGMGWNYTTFTLLFPNQHLPLPTNLLGTTLFTFTFLPTTELLPTTTSMFPNTPLPRLPHQPNSHCLMNPCGKAQQPGDNQRKAAFFSEP
uniref:Uncharacterized protein n=2 Tax=Picea TaxID=3328 RepID=A0A124GNA7_PICGL|nr:hypothetical protein ABT39_MTgene5244 [Picea glauca]QHR92884.1 hypothetical protein Q903MT_gene6932 [Picea sitchensis]